MTTPDSSDEWFDIVDEHDQVVGRETRRQVHQRQLRHRAVHILVSNAQGQVFLQKRSMSKDSAPGRWDSSASGHLDSGEPYDACAVRELREELGLSPAEPPRPIFKLPASPETGWEFVWVYRCTCDGPVRLHPEEIETGDWFAPEHIDGWIAAQPGAFAPAFVRVWLDFRRHTAGRMAG